TEVSTTYLSRISCTVRALLMGSSGSSQPRGLPVSTEQKRQARVHTAPISISVAVPAFQHSPMFGHFASSQTVASRCSFTVALTVSNPFPAGIGARSQCGLRPRFIGTVPAVALMPSLIAVNPCGVRYLSPLRGASPRTMGMPLKLLTSACCCRGPRRWQRANDTARNKKPGTLAGFLVGPTRQGKKSSVVRVDHPKIRQVVPFRILLHRLERLPGLLFLALLHIGNAEQEVRLVHIQHTALLDALLER